MPKHRPFGAIISRPGRPGLYLRIRHRGEQRVRYSGTSKSVAREQLSRIHAALARGLTLDAAIEEVLGPPQNVAPARAPVPAPAPVVPTFAEIAERYVRSVAQEKRESTIEEDRSRLGVVLRAPWAQKPINAISRGELALWIDEIGAKRKDGKGLSGSTLNRYRSIVSVVFEYALERDLIETNPARGLRRADESRRAREVSLTVDQFWALVEQVPPELRLMVAIGASTGLRPGAIREIRWRHLDLEAGTLLAEASYAKSAKPQLFHLDASVVGVLREMKERAREGIDRVFLNQSGKPWTRGWLCQLMRRAVNSCIVIPADVRPKVTFYVLRHTFASLLEQDGLSPRKLQEALAHSDANLTKRYTHLNSEAMREVGLRIGRILKIERITQVREGYDEQVG